MTGSSLSTSAPKKAIALALIAYTCWVVADTFIKLAVATGTPKHELMFCSALFGMIVLFVITLIGGRRAALRPRQPKILFMLAVLFLANYVCWQIGLAHLPLANFYMFPFMAPMVIVVLAGFALGEPAGWRKIAVTALGFAGVVVAVDPHAALRESGSLIGYAAGACGMTIMVVQQLTLRFLGDRESREAIAIYTRLGAVFGGLAGLAVWGFTPLSAKVVLLCLCSGGCGAMGWMLLAQAYQLAPASTVAPFYYSQILSSVLLGFLVWHDVPSLHFVLGAGVIIASGIYILTHARRKIAPPAVNLP